MKFTLTTSAYFYSEKDANELASIGFRFRNAHAFIDRPMTIADPLPEIEINTMEELLTFVDRWGDVIVSRDRIEIYNDYRE